MSAQKLFIELLDRHIRDARIRFLLGDKEIAAGAHALADGAANDLAIRINDSRFFARVLSAGNLGLGEAYMNHEFEMESGSLEDFLLVLLRNQLDRRIRLGPISTLQVAFLRFLDTLRGKIANVQRHYDVGDDLFRAFLDRNLVYSCGYVGDDCHDLDGIQYNKMDRICKKLRLKAGECMLDIGCGYGGLLIHAARHYGVTGVGVTTSRQHCAHGNTRLEQEGLKGQVEIRFGDFNGISGEYDKIVSVGMMEHVPRREYRRYFRKIAQALKQDGVALLHTLGANAPRNEHDPFIQKYIFPNSNQPRLSEITEELEKQELIILDVENMIRHYGYTIREWRRRFLQNRASLDPKRYGDKFMRMWEYYLSCGIAAAFASNSALYQVLFANNRAMQIPLQRV